jgi:hypothetical protein
MCETWFTWLPTQDTEQQQIAPEDVAVCGHPHRYDFGFHLDKVGTKMPPACSMEHEIAKNGTPHEHGRRLGHRECSTSGR